MLAGLSACIKLLLRRTLVL